MLYLQEPGAHVGKRSEHLVVKKDGRQIQRVPIAAVRQVVVFGNVQVSTQALECLAALGVPVVYLNSYGKFLAALMPAAPKNVLLRACQFQAFADPARTFTLPLPPAWCARLRSRPAGCRSTMRRAMSCSASPCSST